MTFLSSFGAYLLMPESLGGGAVLYAVRDAGQGVSDGSPLGQTGLALCFSSVPGGGVAFI